MNEETFLGKPTQYWFELDRQVATQGLEKVVAELAALRAELWIAKGRLDAIRSLMEQPR